MREITVEELAAWRCAGRDFILLDVREPHELQSAAIEGSHHIPMREVPVRLHELPIEKEIVVMCHHGGRSERVAAFLEAQGFDGAINLEGGINDWSLKVDPNVPRY